MNQTITKKDLAKMNSSLFIFVLLLLILHSCQSSEQERPVTSTLSDDQIAKIDSICQSFKAKGNTVGFSVGIAHEGEILYSKGYGLANKDSDKQATEHTIYPIASVSKFVTAILTMKMVDAGMLSLEDKVAVATWVGQVSKQLHSLPVSATSLPLPVRNAYYRLIKTQYENVKRK